MSAMLPTRLKRTPGPDAPNPAPYPGGSSTGDFSEALQALPGPGAKGLSASSAERLKEGWKKDRKVREKRDMSTRRYVYRRTDEFAGCKGIDRFCRKHGTVKRSLDQVVRHDGPGVVATNACESTFGRLKANIPGVHHSVSVKHLPCCLDELADRRNTRDLDTIDRMGEHVLSTIGKGSRHEDLAARTPEQEAVYQARHTGGSSCCSHA